MTGQRFLHPTDRRKAQRKLYGSRQWERVRAVVLARDGRICQVPRREVGGSPPDAICGRPANVADHIIRPEEGGASLDPSNLRAACRSCNMRRHNAAYFRAKVDAAAAGDPVQTPAGSPRLLPERRNGRPSTADAAFPSWAAELHGVSAEPEDHRHGRWDVAPTVDLRGQHLRVCPPSCPSPVRWPQR